jgi:hypothetical protein
MSFFFRLAFQSIFLLLAFRFMILYIHPSLACEHVNSPISPSEPGELGWPESEMGVDILRLFKP